MTPRDTRVRAAARDRQDRRAALGWIAGQLAWENRLHTLRSEDPEPQDDQETGDEVDSAA